MTLTIKIKAHPDAGDMGFQLDRAMLALGYRRTHFQPYASDFCGNVGDDLSGAGLSETAKDSDAASPVPSAPIVQNVTPKRERGKPAAGHARRTKAEIAEDDAADKADAAAQTARAEAHVDEQAVAETRQISSAPENRIDPANVAAQDAADEAAEREDKAGRGHDATRHDVHVALMRYLELFGTPAAMDDGPAILSRHAHATKISELPDDPQIFAAVVNSVGKACVINDGGVNEFGRAPVKKVALNG